MSGPALFNDPRGLPCISLWRPWATWVAFGWKTIETRTHERFRCLERRRIGIHAAMKWDADAVSAAAPFVGLFHPASIATWKGDHGGRIICTAFVQRFAPLRADDSKTALIDCGSVERFGLFLADIIAVPDIPESHVKGGQGIFYVPGLAEFSVPSSLSRKDGRNA
jgi:hypothetical protein